MNNIKSPIFVIADDNTVCFLHEPEKVDYGFFEPVDVADGIYTAYDSEGQILKLVTINEKNGEIERPTEDIINIPFFGKIVGVLHDRTIKAIPQDIYKPDKLTKILVQDLSSSGHNVIGLTLNELVAIYQKKHPKLLLDD
jgi:hypothetical protein